MVKRLIILRGAPGSFKSTYADRIKAKLKGLFGISTVICSADSFFMKTGSYHYDRSKIGKAHEECQEFAKRACRDGVDVVVIDNTNITEREMKPYISLAAEFGYKVVKRVFGLHLSTDELFNRCIHRVPKEKIEIMQTKLRSSLRDHKE